MVATRTTLIDVGEQITGDRNLNRLTNIIMNHTAATTPRKAITEVLNRTAGRARKVALESYDDWLDEPTDFTKSEKGTLFKRARKVKIPTTAAQAAKIQAKQPDIETAVYIKPIQSSYLEDIIVPTKVGELYNKSPVIVPHEKNLKTFEKLRGQHIDQARAGRSQRVRNVRARGGRASDVARVKKLPDVRLLDTGNVFGLKNNKIAKLLEHPDVFAVGLNEVSWLSPGIYVRFDFDATTRAGVDRRFVRKLFHFEPEIQLPGSFPFTESGVQVMRENFAEFMRLELIDCFNELGLRVPRYARRSGE